jgi:hypothetical protein
LKGNGDNNSTKLPKIVKWTINYTYKTIII